MKQLLSRGAISGPRMALHLLVASAAGDLVVSDRLVFCSEYRQMWRYIAIRSRQILPLHKARHRS